MRPVSCCVAAYAGVFALLREFAAFVGQNPTDAKTKIQGLSPTDKLPAVRLFFRSRDEKMKKIIFNLLPAILLWLGSFHVATAQDSGVAQSDQITADGQVIQSDDSSTGKFESVDVDPSATSDVALQFPASLTNKSVAIEALDGGTLSTNSATIDASGNLAFSFQVTDQPGMHRVIVIDPNANEDSPHIIAVVQFEVPPPVN